MDDDERANWWGPMLALGPLVALCAALTGGVALYRIANRSGFNAREVGLAVATEQKRTLSRSVVGA